MQKPLGLSLQRLLCYVLEKAFLPSPPRANTSKGNSKPRTPVRLEDSSAYLEPWIPLFGFILVLVTPWAFLVGQTGKNSPATEGDPGSIPGSRRSLGEGMATHSYILVWGFHGHSLEGYSPWDHKESDTAETRTLTSVLSWGKTTGVGCHSLLQGIFWTQSQVEPGSPALQADSLLSEPPGKPLVYASLPRVFVISCLYSVLNSFYC